jgi:biopolymer transport protein ExbD
MAFRPSKRRHGAYLEQELSLTSLLDMITILVVFLLVTAVFAKTAVIDTYLPKEGGVEAAVPAEKIPDVLVVMTTKDGFELSGLGSELSIPKREGEFDFNALAMEAAKIKERNPEKEEVILLFNPRTSYETVVKVMDATRETADRARKLFPLASLGEGM